MTGTILVNGGSGTLSVPDPPLIKIRDRGPRSTSHSPPLFLGLKGGKVPG
ncbi:hypothetical protein C791_5578 [Amycolatopsis azurea DSM 43854]|uniref:Uncharacterized protein n=1 Tax=Amycolatopsis azurea DSM 43854 TaxID=1238180 RepID=M2PJD1_9PSEU|nr:hypothetical protein C791_5578 [Amycolatopsis azurea DSM 43854]